MSAQIEPRSMTVEEYLAFEERSEIKREYIAGEIYAMAGASARHNRITLNLASRLIAHLRGSAHNTATPAASSIRVSRIRGRPIKPVGSSPSSRSNSAMPSPSDLKLPAHWYGRSRRR